MARGSADSTNSGKKIDLKQLNNRVAAMNAQRDNFSVVWREISDFVSPGRGLFDTTLPNQGEKKHLLLFDSTPSHSLGILAAGMQGGLTSPSKEWFRSVPASPELYDRHDVLLWCTDVDRIMYWAINRGGTYNATHTLYGETGAFGTGALIVEEDPADILLVKPFTAGEWSCEYGVNDRPTAFSRDFWMTAAQLRNAYGYDKLSDQAKRACDNNLFNEWFQVRHLICENKDYQEDSPLAKNMLYMSVYWELNGNTDEPLDVGGYREFPVMITRWDRVGADFYGRGPGWLALQESKTLQEMRKDTLKADKLQIQPPLTAPTAARKQRVSIYPGAIAYSDSDVTHRPIFQPNMDMNAHAASVIDSRDMIRKAFFADLFAMIAGMDNRDMTAREVAERHEEKMLILGPVIERLEQEFLTPFLRRVFLILDRRGFIPPPPAILRGKPLEFEYISLLAQAQRMVGISAIDRMVNMVGYIANVSPESMDVVNPDAMIREYARMVGATEKILRDPEEIAVMRGQRAQQQQQARQMAAAEAEAKTMKSATGSVKDLAGSPTQGGGSNALEGLLSAMGGGGA